MAGEELVRRAHSERLVLHCMEMDEHRDDFRAEVERGLASQPKRLAPKFFYDERGSQLFEQITETEEYYVTRTEAAILSEHGEAILDAAGSTITMVELGSGSSTKTRLLLDVLSRRQPRLDYVPVDISPSIVTAFGEQLLADYPTLHISGLICDYHRALDELKTRPDEAKLYLFLGSSLGNYTPAQARRLLRSIREAMGSQDRILLGLDMKKEREVLEAAYDDAQGVTAAFNLNLLQRINTELGGHFDLERFRHLALYNDDEGRVEMHLQSTESQIVPVDALGRTFSFHREETIHTENSYKFDQDRLESMVHGGQLRLEQQWTDERGWFSLSLLAPA